MDIFSVTIPKPKAIICDIEGTTTSMRFWSNVLGPFVTSQVATCLREWWSRPEVKDTVTLLRDATMTEWLQGNRMLPLIEKADRPMEDVIHSVDLNVTYQMKARRNNQELKAIILLVWLYGYKKKRIKGMKR